MFSKKTFFLMSVPLVFLIGWGFIYIFNPPRVEMKDIGILFYQNNPTTSSFLNGFKAGLAKQGYYPGKNLRLFVRNMQKASPHAISGIIREIGRKRVHLLVTTGKDLTVATAHAISSKPIIYALVSRPMTNETRQTVEELNITGVSYYTPYDRTIELGKRLIPNFRRIALLLPENSVWPDYGRMKEAVRKAGVQLVPAKTSLRKLTLTIAGLRGQADAVYLPYDIELIIRNNEIRKALLAAGLPAIANNLEYQSSCVLTYYADPEVIGEIAGQMAVKIFHKAKTEYLPVELSSFYQLTLNLKLLRILNISTEEDILSYANAIIR